MSSLHSPPPPLASWARTTPTVTIATSTTPPILAPQAAITPAQVIVTLLLGLLLLYLIIPQRVMDWVDAYMELPYLSSSPHTMFQNILVSP
jgi:hypothetical protein